MKSLNPNPPTPIQKWTNKEIDLFMDEDETWHATLQEGGIRLKGHGNTPGKAKKALRRSLELNTKSKSFIEVGDILDGEE